MNRTEEYTNHRLTQLDADKIPTAGKTPPLPEGWECRKLGDVCEVLDKKRKPITKKFREQGPIPYYGATGVLDHVKDYIFDEQLVLLGEDGAKWGKFQNSAYLIKGKSWVNNHAHVLRPKKNILDDFWLKYCLNMQNLLPFISGLTVPKLNQSNMKIIPIPLPPLAEQKRIVAILDEAFAAIDKAKANAEKNLANAKELFESYLNGIFANPGEDWEEKKLYHISQNLDSKRKPVTKRDRKKGEYPYYGASGIVDYVDDYIFDEELLLISEDGANLLTRTYPIAFSIHGKAWVNNHAHVLKFTNLFTQKFVQEYLNHTRIDEYVSGMAQPKLNQRMLNQIPILLPDEKEQRIIVKQIDKVSSEIKQLESIFQHKITLLDELKKSILKKAFEGKL
jgi:type I restriction enzyme, S subunit